MHATIYKMFVVDDIAACRITAFLWEVVTKMKEKLLGLGGSGCDPDTFYNEVRPWLAGCDSNKRKWVFEGLKEAILPIQKCERGEEEETIRLKSCLGRAPDNAFRPKKRQTRHTNYDKPKCRSSVLSCENRTGVTKSSALSQTLHPSSVPMALESLTSWMPSPLFWVSRAPS
jgi:hypothetical protein